MANDSQPDVVVTLWQAQGSDGFRMSTEDIRRRIETMNRKMRRRTFDGYLMCAVLIVFFIGWMFVGMGSLQKVGAVLSIIGLSYLALQIHQNRFRGAATGDAGNTASLDHLRTELARQRDFHRGATFWSRMLVFAPGPLVFFAGFAQAQQANPVVVRIIHFETISCVVFLIAAIPLNLWMARRYQRQIDELSRLQEEA
jgi:Flp pilus assembly protein TadB